MEKLSTLIYDNKNKAKLIIKWGERKGEIVAIGSIIAVIAAANLLFPDDYDKYFVGYDK